MLKYKRIIILGITMLCFSAGAINIAGAQDSEKIININKSNAVNNKAVELLKDSESRRPYLIRVQKIENNADTPEIFEQMKQNNIKLLDYISSQLASRPNDIKVNLKMESIGVISIMANREGLEFIKTVKGVSNISEDKIQSPLLYQSIPRIGGSVDSGFPATPTALNNQYTGEGRVVAIIDSNFSNTHPMLTGKIVKSYCNGFEQPSPSGSIHSSCGGSTTSLGDGCTPAIEGCGHGILVSSVATGNKVTATIQGDSAARPDLYPSPAKQNNYILSGVAKGASVYGFSSGAIFSEASGQPDLCGDPANQTQSCLRFPGAMVLDSLNKLVSDINDGSISNVDSVNLSLGGSSGYQTTREACDNSTENEDLDPAYLALKSKGVAIVRAAGNEGNISETGQASNANKIDGGTCGVGVVIVGASYTNQDKMANYSNASEDIMDLVAPGGDTPIANFSLNDAWNNLLVSAHQNNGETALITKKDADYAHYFGGTSSAAPHVSGAFAVIREQHPKITVDRALKLFKDTADPITDDRPGYAGNIYKRLNLGKAIKESDVFPDVTSATFDKTEVNSGDNVTLAINATNATKCSVNNTVGDVQISGGTATKTFPATNIDYSITCESEYGDVSTAKTVSINLISAPVIIQPPTNLNVDNITTSSATINFTGSTTTTVSFYEAWLDGVKLATASASDNKINISGLQSGKRYAVDIYAVDASGAKSEAAKTTFSTLVQTVDPPKDTTIEKNVSEQVNKIINQDSSNNSGTASTKINVPKTGKVAAIALITVTVVSVGLSVVMVTEKIKSSKSAER